MLPNCPVWLFTRKLKHSSVAISSKLCVHPGVATKGTTWGNGTPVMMADENRNCVALQIFGVKFSAMIVLQFPVQFGWSQYVISSGVMAGWGPLARRVAVDREAAITALFSGATAAAYVTEKVEEADKMRNTDLQYIVKEGLITSSITHKQRRSFYTIPQALGFMRISFKVNASLDIWWEGRKQRQSPDTLISWSIFIEFFFSTYAKNLSRQISEQDGMKQISKASQ